MDGNRQRVRKKIEFTPHLTNINTIRLGNDVSKCLLASAHLDGRVRVYSLQSENNTTIAESMIELGGPASSSYTSSSSAAAAPSVVSSLVFDRDESFLATGAENGKIKIFDLKTNQIFRTFSGHRAQVGALDYYQYMGSELICSGSADSSIKLWDIRRRGKLTEYKGSTGHSKPITVLRFRYTRVFNYW